MLISRRYTSSLPFSLPFVGVTAEQLFPPPIAFASLPATVLTEPPLMVIPEPGAPQPPPIPAPLEPPVAVTVPPLMVIPEPVPLQPPPIPALEAPPVAVTVPPLMVISEPDL